VIVFGSRARRLARFRDVVVSGCLAVSSTVDALAQPRYEAAGKRRPERALVYTAPQAPESSGTALVAIFIIGFVMRWRTP